MRAPAGQPAWLLATVFALAACAGAAARTVYVNGTTGNDAWTGLCQTWDGATCGPKQTIQTGIDAAVAGDTVLVADGTYTGTGNKEINLSGKDITLLSAKGPVSCIIDCENSGRAFYFYSRETPAAVVDGLTVRNALPLDEMPGGAVHCENASPTLRNCIFTHNESRSSGGAVAWFGGVITIEGCAFVDNAVWDGGGGALVLSGSGGVIAHCTFVGNIAGDCGGAIAYDGQGTLTLTNSILYDDTASRGNEVTLNQGRRTVLIVGFCLVEGGRSSIVDIGGAPSTVIWKDGNLDVDPLLTRDGVHLQQGSPCTDAGDPADAYVDRPDMDGDTRSAGGRADVGADEYQDTDGDGLPDWWEQRYFGAPTAGDPSADEDGDGRCDLDEYGQSRDPELPSITYYVDNDGSDAWDGRAPSWDGQHGPTATIQAAIDRAGPVEGDVVVVADGVYTGAGNKNLDYRDKAIIVRSASGARACTIDCQGAGRAAYFFRGEREDSILDGFTIRNGNVTGYGGGIQCDSSHPSIRNCVITDCRSAVAGGGLWCRRGNPRIVNCTIARNTCSGIGLSGGGGGAKCEIGRPALVNCTIADNSSAGYGGGLYLSQVDALVANCIVWNNTAPEGDGIEVIGADSRLRVSCDDIYHGIAGIDTWEMPTLVWGPGMIDVDPGFALPGDYHLTAGSPCIDAGTTAWPLSVSDLDGDGNARLEDGDGDGAATIDLGAFEYAPAAPTIALAPAELVFSALVGGPNPDPQSFTLCNSGASALSWSVVESCGWLGVNPASGTSLGEPVPVSVALETAGLDYGDYFCVLRVEAPGATNTPRQVAVKLRVNREWTVPGDFATIQAALDAAVDGDRVLVADGVYSGAGNTQLDFRGKRLTLRSANGPEQTAIDCAQTAPGFNLHSGETAASVVEGFTVRNARAQGSGAAVYCSNKSSPSLVQCVFADCSAGSEGGAVYADGGSPTVDRCTFLRCTSGSNGGAIRVRRGTLAVSGSTFSSCTAAATGGAVSCYDGQAALSGCAFSANRATGSGGALSLVYNQPSTVTGCQFSGNHSGDHGGAVYCRQPEAALADCVFTANDASLGGGGICVGDSGQVSLRACVFVGNSALQYGGAASTYYSSTLNGTGCVFAGNTAPRAGGVHLRAYCHVTLGSCTFTENIATGRAIYCEPGGNSAALTNCVVWDGGDEIRISGTSAATATYSDVQGGWSGTGNLELDPLFIDADGADNVPGTDDDNVHLGPLSPCIDAGDPASDFSLEPEPNGGRVNMGAYGNTPQAETRGWVYIRGYHQVRRTQITRTVFDSELTVTVHNASGQPVSGVVAEVLSVPAIAQVIEGRVNLGDMPAQTVVESGDTFTIRVDRNTLGSPLPVAWHVTYADGVGDFTTLLELAPPRPGDTNCDGVVDFDDINPFVQALIEEELYYNHHRDCDWMNADCNDDGVVGFDDINSFVGLLTP